MARPAVVFGLREAAASVDAVVADEDASADTSAGASLMAHTLGLRRTPRGSRRGGGARVEREEAILSDTTDPRVALSRLRASIDNIDAALIYLLAERFRSTTQVGHLKAEHGMPASDPAREEQQIARLRALAADADLDPAFAEKWFNFVVAEVIRHHTAAADAR